MTEGGREFLEITQNPTNIHGSNLIEANLKISRVRIKLPPGIYVYQRDNGAIMYIYLVRNIIILVACDREYVFILEC
jgi:hypothetical protein